jgi:hypothetical protein
MNSNKIICVFVILFNFHAFALEKWLFEINHHINIECEGDKDERFWLCKNDNISGFIDKEPIDKNIPFLFMLIKEQKVILDIEITNHKIYKSINFDYKNYYKLNKSSKEKINVKYYDQMRDDNIKILFTTFLDLLKVYFEDLKQQKVYQKIYQYDNCIYSEFLIDESITKKVHNDPLDVTLSLTLDYKDKHDKITDHRINYSINYEQAENLLKEIANNKRISFEYTKDGCHARAHIICFLLSLKKIDAKKIWIAGNIHNPFSQKQDWSYHVAVIIYVKNNNNIIEELVIDPALNANKLLTTYEWLQAYKAQEARLVSFPIPSESYYFENVVMAYSSHVPLFPFFYECSFTFIESLNEAYKENKKYCQKLLKHKSY